MIDFRPHTMQVKRSTGGGCEDGNPVPVSESWSEPIPCRYESDGKESFLTGAGDRFHIPYTYEVWLDRLDENLEGKTVRLFDESGNLVAEKQVQKQPPRQLRVKLYL